MILEITLAVGLLRSRWQIAKRRVLERWMCAQLYPAHHVGDDPTILDGWSATLPLPGYVNSHIHTLLIWRHLT